MKRRLVLSDKSKKPSRKKIKEPVRDEGTIIAYNINQIKHFDTF